MIPRELIEGVQKMLHAGASREIVSDFLLERGWSEDDAREVFATLDAESIQKAKKEEKPKVDSRAIRPPSEQSPKRQKTEDQQEVLKKETKKTEVREAPAVVVPRLAEEPQEKKSEPVVFKKEPEQKPEPEPEPEQKPVPAPTREKEVRVTTSAPNTSETLRVPTPSRNEPVREKVPREQVGVKKEVQVSDARSEEQEEERRELFEMNKLSSPLRLLSISFVLVRQRFWSLFFLTFMVSVFYLVLYILLSYIATAQNIANVSQLIVDGQVGVLVTTSILVILAILLGFLATGLLLWLPAAYILAFSGRATSFRDLFIQGSRGGFSLLAASTFVLLFTLSGSVLLVLPGLVLGVWFVFAPLITVIERTPPFVALLVSRELIRRHFWDVVVREAFLIIPVLLSAIFLLLLLTPLSLLDSLGESFGVGIGLIVFIFIAFAALLFIFACMLFFFAYHVSLYKEMRARTPSIKLSSRLGRTLPFLLIVPLFLSLAVAFYVSALL